MRDFITNDIFTMSRILKKMALDIDFKNIDIKNKTEKQVGLEMVGKIANTTLQNLHMAQDEVNNFLGELNGMTGEQFGKLPLTESARLFNEFKNKVPSDFFKLAGQMK